MDNLLGFVRAQAKGGVLSWADQSKAAAVFCTSLAAVEKLALENSILPARYRRNQSMITASEQLQLFQGRVAVIGCGGLGGYVIEELARLGVGIIIAVDPDLFEEHNLNRQLLATMTMLGQPKVAAASARVAEINPAVTLVPLQTAYCEENGKELIQGSQVVVDALDSIPTRLLLAETCSELAIPLVHGAIAGWYGQVATQLPGSSTLQSIYANRGAEKGVESQLGNPSFTPAVVASLQVAEVCKILLGRDGLLDNRKLFVDLLHMEFCETRFSVS